MHEKASSRRWNMHEKAILRRKNMHEKASRRMQIRHEKASSAAQAVPFTVAADLASLSGRENMGLYSICKIFPSDLCAFAQAAERKHLTVIRFCLAGSFGGASRALPKVVIGTAGAYIVGFAKQDHFWVPAQCFLHSLHIFNKITAVALSLKKGKAHAVMCPDPV